VEPAEAETAALPEETAESTPTPEPTITPTPAVYAPYGAQYGHGGANLIPETPTPEPTPAPTPTPIASPTPIPEPTAVRYTTLRRGATGPSVVRLQEALIALGYLEGSADGDFGGNTQSAVVQFQAVNGLSADGIAGNQTLTLLYSGHALAASEAPEMDYLILVNRENKLDKNYAPTDLVEIADVIPSSVLKVKYKGTKANRTAAEALGRMLEDAIADGVTNWQVSSAYRKYSDQQALVDQSVAKYKKNNPDWSRDRCLSATYQTVAPAGTSEHMTGLAFDITVPGVSFSGTEQQKWLHEHCYEYGFIVRFTEDKQKLTGFLAESWHFRYVGVEAAQVMTYNNWCLEEYVEKMGLNK
ncbi:MAG: D-alanyl-D-alanine carboxypeptidase family protein, partial [Clostridia bacterium]|nr:D-alanyl-D-alanine carboxypeptidase family protein [Clostridia bacterium]